MDHLQSTLLIQLLHVARTNYYYRSFYDGFIHVVPDMDGVRLLTNDSLEFMHKVPGIKSD